MSNLLRSDSYFLSTNSPSEENADGQNDRNRSRHDQLLHGRARRIRAHRHPERRGRAHDAVRGRLRTGRPAAGRRPREAPAGHQSDQHDLLDQAVHGPQARGGLGGDDDRPLRGRQGRKRGRTRQGGGQGVRAAGDLGDDPPEAEGGCRGLPRRDGHGCCRHRSRVLQQRAARGDQGRGQDRRPQRASHHQRADRRRARVRPRQGRCGADDSRLRPGRRHVRRVGARARRRRLRGQGHERGQPSRRRQLRQGRRRLDDLGVQARPGHRPRPGPDGASAPVRGGGEGEDRALLDDDDADQPALHHRDARGPEAPRPPAHSRQAERARARPARAHRGTDEEGDLGRGADRARTSST